MKPFVYPLKMKITYNTIWNLNILKEQWKYGSQVFIVYMNFIALDSTLMIFNSKRFMYMAYFDKFWQIVLGSFFFVLFFSMLLLNKQSVTLMFWKLQWFSIGIKCCKNFAVYWKYLILKCILCEVSHMWRVLFSLSKRLWLLHSLTSFLYTKNVTWWYCFKKCLLRTCSDYIT